MAKKGWLRDKGNPNPGGPIELASFSIVDDFRGQIAAVAVVCFEAVRQGMGPEEVMALDKDPVDPRVAHLF